MFLVAQKKRLNEKVHLGMQSSVVPRSRFLGDTGFPLPEFQGDFTNSGGHTKILKILRFKLNSYPEISVFYLNLSSMSIVLAREGV